MQSDYAHDVLFVGGAEPDWAAFMREFMRHGSPVLLAGASVSGLPSLRMGIKPPEIVRALTAAAKVNLCLVRRANRDGHVMRSLEIAAIGGCMLAQDTDEHRDIFGPEAETVIYFGDAKEAAQRACALLCDSSERKRLSVCLQRRIAGGAHTYAHRTMLRIANGR